MMNQTKHVPPKTEEKKNQTPWHSLDSEEIYYKLNTQRTGLSEDEVAKRLIEYGPNALPHRKPPTLIEIFFHQLLNPLIFILLAAGLASLLIGEATDAIFILAVIFINGGLGTYQEFNAEKSAAALQSMLHIITKVKRGNKFRELDAENLVPGDIVYLESGDKVPADLRLIEVNSLLVDESFLTGESLPVEKNVGAISPQTPLSDKLNMAFAGATVNGGRAVGVVVATGLQTQVGQIASNVSETTGGKPPLVLRMERFTKQISYVILGISFGLAIMLKLEGMDYASIFFFVVALAVSAIPEGLPVALTVALSIATSRMSKRNVIVRKLTAVESLGSCTIIASDKTGTLTLNQQTVQQVTLPDGGKFEITGVGYHGEGVVNSISSQNPQPEQLEKLNRLAIAACLANEAELEKKGENWEHMGDAMDVGFLALAFKIGINYSQEREKIKVLMEVPYESELKYAALFYEFEGKAYLAIKGALESILAFCSPLNNGENINQLAEEMAEKGLRVLAVAHGEVRLDSGSVSYDLNNVKELTLCGLAGFIDPLRTEVKQSVDTCRDAGIKVLMITGDHPATAAAISSELGIREPNEHVVTGAELTAAGDPLGKPFEKLVHATRVFARVSPTQKFEIVDALIRNGDFVAVTGDGVNDTPALRKANIGVAMGSGTDVAKEVGDMIITDDNFSSIVAGVEEGRFAYDNVRKVISLLISTGLAEVLLFIASVFFGLPLPLLAVQLLWLNLVTNGIQDVALAFEGGEKDVMKNPPRNPKESVFDKTMIAQTLVSGLWMGVLTLGAWYYLVEFLGMKDEELPHARNLLLLLFVLLQNVHVFNCRSERHSAFRVPLSRNYMLLWGVIAALGLHLACIYIPFMQKILHLKNVSLAEFGTMALLAFSIMVIYEIYKFIRFGKKSFEEG